MSTIAFALGGLAGSNAHGAGCLQAVIDKWGARTPQVISCTSGQIFWVCVYLQYLELLKNSNLSPPRNPPPSRHYIRDAFVREQDRMKPFFNIAHSCYRYAFHDWPVPRVTWDTWNRFWGTNLEDSCRNNAETVLRATFLPWNDAWFHQIEPRTLRFIPPLHALMHERDWAILSRTCLGVPDKFTFQLWQVTINFLHNLVNSWNKVLLSTLDDNFAFKHFSLWHLWPAHTLEQRLFSHQQLQEWFDLINTSPIAILFNSYEPTTGQEIVYYNPAAANIPSLLPKAPVTPPKHHYRDHVRYCVLTPDAFQDALWLNLYGYQPGQRIDGAYFRQIMLSELQGSDKIYVVRPVNRYWKAGTLKTDEDRQDMQFDILFNGSYQAEEDRFELINKLIDEKKLLANTSFKPIEIIPCEIRRPRGYWEYIFEDITVFDDARHDFYQLI